MATLTGLYDVSTEDVVDSRDIEELIDDMESDEEDAREKGEPYDRREELNALRAIRDEVGDDEEWCNGLALIRDSYFEDYARETAEDCYGTGEDKLGPLANYIDWEKWARDVRMDYSCVEIDGVTFWYRG